jgi:hypothetical protein
MSPPQPGYGPEMEFDISPPQKGYSEVSPKKVNFVQEFTPDIPQPSILDPGNTLLSADSPQKPVSPKIPPSSSVPLQPQPTPSFCDQTNHHQFALKSPSPSLPADPLPGLLSIVENLNQKYFDVHETYDSYFTVDKLFGETRIRAFLADSIFTSNSLFFSEEFFQDLTKQLKIKGHGADSPATNLFEPFFTALVTALKNTEVGQNTTITDVVVTITRNLFNGIGAAVDGSAILVMSIGKFLGEFCDTLKKSVKFFYFFFWVKILIAVPL